MFSWRNEGVRGYSISRVQSRCARLFILFTSLSPQFFFVNPSGKLAQLKLCVSTTRQGKHARDDKGLQERMRKITKQSTKLSFASAYYTKGLCASVPITTGSIDLDMYTVYMQYMMYPSRLSIRSTE